MFIFNLIKKAWLKKAKLNYLKNESVWISQFTQRRGVKALKKND